MHRIELSQYHLDIPDEELLLMKQLGFAPRPGEVKKRRFWVPFKDIHFPAEIPGETERCIVMLRDGRQFIIAENYDALCIRLSDFENNMLVADE